MARSSVRTKPYVVEIQRHYHLDELNRKGKKGHHIRPPVNPSVPPRTHSSTRKSFEGGVPKVRHVSMDPSRLNRGSLEYEDIYNQRNSSENSHLKQHGRWSFRDDSGYGRERGYTRRSPGIARPTELRLMNGDVEHSGKTIDRSDITDTKNQNGTVGDKNDHMRANYKRGNTSTSREGSNHEQRRVTKDSNGNQRDDLELWIARQTSFPKKQDGMVDMSNQRILKNTAVSQVSSQSRPPPVAPKPYRPQTSRSASPASSVRSDHSGASSHVSQHSARSATSEVSVKSILKKHKPAGRVVLKEEPPSYTLCAVLSCILCFPFGIYAVATSKRVKEAVEENDYESALSSSRKVKHFCFGVLVAYIGILVVVGALLAVYFTTGKIF